MESTLKSAIRAYPRYFLLWTVVGLFFFTQGLLQKFASHDPTPWWHYLVTWITGVYISALLTPAVVWLGRRFPFERTNWIRRILLHLALSFVFTVISLSLHSFLLPKLGLFPSIMKSVGGTFAVLVIIGFHQALATYWLILVVQYAIDYYHRYQEREREALRLERDRAELKEQLVRAQLGALKMQLQPHFLFNTLNAIMVLVRQQKGKQAEEMLARLGDLLRCVLEDVEAQEVPLRRELEYLRLYLSIEEVRFQDRMRVDISAEPVILDAAVPHMVLQPIVENAIRHGLGKSSSAGRIQINARRVNGTLEIQVQDDGPGLPADVFSIRGIGLSNTRARLKQLYADSGQLTIENGEQGGVVVTILLPYRAAPGLSEAELIEFHALNGIAG